MVKQLREIREILKNNLQGRVKTFFLGKPYAIPLSSLPAIYVDVLSVEITPYDTASDLHKAQIIVGVAVKKNNTPSDEKTDFLELLEIMEGKDDLGDIKENSVIGIMRKRKQGQNITGGISLESNSASINYEPDELETENVIVRQATFTFIFINQVN